MILRSGLETLQTNRRHSMFFHTVNLAEMVMCLEDLINYFAQPEDDMGMLIPKIMSNIVFIISLLQQNTRKNKID